jgi:3-oxoadipate enol-lactonase
MTEFQPQTGFLDTQGAPLYYEVAGTGQPLLLIHSGITDSRMWDNQFHTFSQQYRVVRYDLRGFGKSMIPAGPFANHEDVTLAYPEKVTALVLGAPSVSGLQSSSADIQRFEEEEVAFLEQGDLAGATELNLRMWVDGPRRTPDQVDPTVRQRIYEMQYHAFTIPIPVEAELLPLEPPAISRLAEIHVPTLLIAGEYDVPDKHELVGQLAMEIPQARQVVILDAAHIVNMEQPAEFNRVVLEFLKESAT